MASRRHHSRSRSPRPSLPSGVSEISESDYFLKSAEFRVWLKQEKGKYFDELSGEKARSYFRKFVKAWNRALLPPTLYQGVDPSSTSHTAYKWSFAQSPSRADEEARKTVRDAVGGANYGGPNASAGGSAGSSRVIGPTLPTASDLVLAREHSQSQRSLSLKRARAEGKEHIEDMLGPKEVGREGMLERKRARREGDRAFREKGDGGEEVDEGTLMGTGTGDSFQAQIARRDAARKRTREDKAAATRERGNAFREKEKATMGMFQELARQRFG